MKKLFLILVFLFCGVILFLATVDLSVYLKPVGPEQFATAPPDDVQAADPLPVNPKKSVVIISPPQIETALSQATETLQKEALPPKTDIKQNLVPRKTIPDLDSKTLPANSIKAAVVGQASPTSVQRDLTEPVTAQTPDCQQLSPGEYPFSILLETFDLRETAINAVQLYKEKGINTYLVKVDLGSKGIKYRLFTGAFTDQENAESYAQQKGLADKPVKMTRFSALLDTANQSEDINSLLETAKKAETMPYLLCTGGRQYIFVGAFYTITGAKTQCDKLADIGLSCRPVVRSLSSKP